MCGPYPVSARVNCTIPLVTSVYGRRVIAYLLDNHAFKLHGSYEKRCERCDSRVKSTVLELLGPIIRE
jgi:hypothetical protein